VGRTLARIIGAVSVVCEALLFAMMLIVAAGVFAREVVDSPLHVTEEFAAYLLVALTFLAAGVSLHEGALFRVGVIYERLPTRARLVVGLAWDAGALVFSAIVGWQLYRLVVSSYTKGIVSTTTGSGTPQYIPQIVMPLGFALLSIVLAVQVGSRILALLRTSGRNRS